MEKIIGKRPSRESLFANKAIGKADKARKTPLKIKEPVKPKPSSLTAAADRISKIAKCIRLPQEKE